MQEFKGDRKLTAVVVKDIKTGEVMEMNPAGVFAFIGLQPNTDFVKDAVDLDAQRFAKTSATVETTFRECSPPATSGRAAPSRSQAPWERVRRPR